MSRPIRYTVYIPSQEPVSYNCGLGNREAKSWAIDTARDHGGVVREEWADGSIETIRDFRSERFDHEAPATQPLTTPAFAERL